MANMNYCRFQNTAADLDDCLETIENASDLEKELSHEEYKAAKQLYEIAKRYVELFP